jgi:membrane-bound ClpP family serine protease
VTFGRRWPLAALAIVAANAGLLTLARAALRATADHKAMVRAGFAHLFCSLGVVFLPYALFTSGIAAATIVAVYALPVAVLGVRMTRRRVFVAMLPHPSSPGQERE